jgi:Icc-related predicted phosphoesterase
VVVTHHAPSASSIAGDYKHDILSASYASDLANLIAEHDPSLWIHGHVK